MQAILPGQFVTLLRHVGEDECVVCSEEGKVFLFKVKLKRNNDF